MMDKKEWRILKLKPNTKKNISKGLPAAAWVDAGIIPNDDLMTKNEMIKKMNEIKFTTKYDLCGINVVNLEVVQC